MLEEFAEENAKLPKTIRMKKKRTQSQLNQYGMDSGQQKYYTVAQNSPTRIESGVFDLYNKTKNKLNLLGRD